MDRTRIPNRALQFIVIVIGIAGIFPPALAAESATLAGTIFDEHGEPLERASVTLSGSGLQPSRTVTGSDGTYRFPALNSGSLYNLTVQREGYRTQVIEGLGVVMGRARVQDVRLRRPGERDVVILTSRDPFAYEEFVRVLRRQLDVTLAVFDLDDDPSPELTVRRVREERPNLIITTGLRAARLVRREVRDIPVLLTLITDPRRYDLEAANIGMVSNHPVADDLTKRLGGILPDARRIGVVYDARESSLLARDLRRSARRAGFEVEVRPCHRATDLPEALDSLLGRIDALLVPYDLLTAATGAADLVTNWALRHRIPLAAPGPDWVRRGALFSYGANAETTAFNVSWVASQILFNGGQPADFALWAPSNGILAINEGTAFALGIEIPADLEFDLTY